MPVLFGKRRTLRTPQHVSTLCPPNPLIGLLPILTSESQEAFLDIGILTLYTVHKRSARTRR